MLQILIITRVSIPSQDPQSQVDACTQYAKCHGLEITGVCHQCGKAISLPETLQSGDTVLINEVSRLGRNRNVLDSLDRLDGIKVIAVNEDIDLTTESGRLIADLFLRICVYESEMRSIRHRKRKQA